MHASTISPGLHTLASASSMAASVASAASCRITMKTGVAISLPEGVFSTGVTTEHSNISSSVEGAGATVHLHFAWHFSGPVEP